MATKEESSKTKEEKGKEIDVFVNVTGVSMNTEVELEKNDDKRTSKQNQNGTSREEKPVST
ncbi:hypothetical protein CL634_11585 [bacterium]|nr:hypothetical protein [bacterium]|tara:strand:+ start:409 stop:591 length:183 start_codon:yes stop_codon:yes gene_type:complete